MELVSHRDAAAFAAAAGPLYHADPARHTVALTVLDGLVRAGKQPVTALTLHKAGGGAVAGLLHAADRGALVSGVPARFAPVLARAVPDEGLAGCSGPVPEAEAFAAAWSERTGAPVRVGRRLRLFALGTLVPPGGVPGGARRVTGSDGPGAGVLATMREAFEVEDSGAWTGSLTPRQVVSDALRLGYGELLWEVEGTPVAQASVRAPVAATSRIGPVYTAPAHRRRGYGAAVTAAASLWALEAGAERVVLFADAANTTTNRLYPRLGFRFDHDAVAVQFRSP